MQIRRYGFAAVLVELPGSDEVDALLAALEHRPVAGTVDTMPGLRTVAVRFDPRETDAAAVAAALRRLPLRTLGGRPERETTVRVSYDGADLDEAAALCAMSPDDLVAAHVARTYRVVLIGMAPGFYFLAGGDPRLQVPRRSTPRTDVPRGALGLAGEHSGIYPRTGPGGWQLIGTVLDELWHPDELPAARLALHDTVRFLAA